MPEFERHIFVCENTRPLKNPRGCCNPEGNGILRAVFKEGLKHRGLKGRVRANRAGCLDQCEHGPCVVVYPEAIWYGRVQPADVEEILERHIGQGEVVERLALPDSCINNPTCPHRKHRK